MYIVYSAPLPTAAIGEPLVVFGGLLMVGLTLIACGLYVLQRGR